MVALSVDELEARHKELRADDQAGPLALLQQSDMRWVDPEIDRALSELPVEFRATVLMVDVEQLTYEEAARALDCPVGTVRSRLSRARKILHGSLLQYARQYGYCRQGKRS